MLYPALRRATKSYLAAWGGWSEDGVGRPTKSYLVAWEGWRGQGYQVLSGQGCQVLSGSIQVLSGSIIWYVSIVSPLPYEWMLPEGWDTSFCTHKAKVNWFAVSQIFPKHFNWLRRINKNKRKNRHKLQENMIFFKEMVYFIILFLFPRFFRPF